MTTRIARVPYLNSAPYFHGLSLGEPFTLTDCVPREVGAQAASGELLAGLLPLADFFLVEERYERIRPFGIAVRGRAHSVLLFSDTPIRQLEGATIAVTEESSTTALLLRLLLEQRYGVIPGKYERGQSQDADALLLIGDAALRFRATNTRYPFETDLAFEWWLWQHLPCVFAVWVIRKDASPQEKKQVEHGLIRTLGLNNSRLTQIAAERSAALGLPAADLDAYLSRFIYRFGSREEDGISRFRELVNEHKLLSAR